MTNPPPTQPEDRPLLLGIRDAAPPPAFRSASTVRNLAADGTIETTQIGRRRMVPRSVLERLAAARRARA